MRSKKALIKIVIMYPKELLGWHDEVEIPIKKIKGKEVAVTNILKKILKEL